MLAHLKSTVTQAARAKLSSAEIALFINGDPAAIDYRAASLQQQVKTKWSKKERKKVVQKKKKKQKVVHD